MLYESLIACAQPGFVRATTQAGEAWAANVMDKIERARVAAVDERNGLLADINLDLVNELNRKREELKGTKLELEESETIRANLNRNLCIREGELNGTRAVLGFLNKCLKEHKDTEILARRVGSHKRKNGEALNLRDYLYWSAYIKTLIERGYDTPRIRQTNPDVEDIEAFTHVKPVMGVALPEDPARLSEAAAIIEDARSRPQYIGNKEERIVNKV